MYLLFMTAYSSTTTSFGRGGGPIHSKYFYCTGTEERLSQCESRNETVSRSHSSDVGMYCTLGMCDVEHLLTSTLQNKLQTKLTYTPLAM